MATIASFNVALVASTGRFVAAISQAERTWNNFARSVQRNAKMMPKAIQEATPVSLALGRAVVKAAAVAGAALSGLGVWGARLAADFEQTRIAFTTLLGDAQRADRFLRQLDIFARRTPFNVENLRQASRQLLAFGFAADQVLSMLTPVGDAIAALGGSPEVMERLIRAIGQIQTKGRLMAEEMNQLTEAGISGWRYVAEELGVSTAKVMDLTRKGAIDSATAIRALLRGMTRDFGGAMEAQSRTIFGQWEQIKEGVTIIVRGIGQDIIRIFGVASAMERLNAALGRFADLVAEIGFGNALARMIPPWLQAAIVGVAGAIMGALVPAIVSWLIPALRKLGVSLWATIRPLSVWMAVGAAVAVTVWLIARYWGQLPSIARAAWGAVSAVVLYAASLVVRGAGLIVAALSWFIPSLRGAAQSVLGLADSLKAAASQSLSVARTAVQAAQGTQAAAASAQKTAQTAKQAAQAQQGLGDAMEGAAKSAQDNIQSFDEVHQIQQEMGGAADLAAGAIEMPEVAVPGAPDIAGGIGGGIASLGEQVSRVAQIASAAWERLKQAMEPVNRAVQWIRDNWPTIGPIVEGIAAAITLLLLPAMIRTGVIALASAGRVVLAWTMQGLAAARNVAVQLVQFGLAGARWVWLGIQATVNAAKVVLAWAIQGWQAAASVAVQVVQFTLAIGRWVALGVAATLNAARVVEAWLVQKVEALASAQVQGVQFTTLIARWAALAWEAAANAARVVAAWVAQKVEAIASAAAQIPQFVMLIGQWIAMGVQATVQAARVVAAWAIQRAAAIGSVALQVVQIGIVVAHWAILGAQALFHAARIALAWVIALGPVAWVIATVALVVAVVIAYWDQIRAATETAWTAVSNWLVSAWEWIKATAIQVWEAIKAFFARWWDELLAIFTGPIGVIVYLVAHNWDTIRAGTQQVWDSISSWLSGTWDRIKSSVSSTWESLRSTITGVWEAIRQRTADIWDSVRDTIRNSINGIIEIVNRFIRAFNRIEIRVPKIEIPLVGTVGGWSIRLPQIPEIPMLAQGGDIIGSGLAVVGESGPELVSLPRGARVTPLADGGDLEDTVYRAVYQAVYDALSERAGETDQAPEIVLRVDGRTLARLTLPHIIAEGQRQGLPLVVRPQGV